MSAPGPLGEGISDEGIVTGEAVELDLRLARLPSRLLALSIDLLVEFAVLLVAFTMLGAVNADPALATALGIATLVVVAIGYPVVWETLSRGRTLGKLALGLRVVREDGGPVRFRHALVRGLFLFFVDLWVTSGVVGLISSLISPRGRRVGDVFAGTLEVRESLPASAAAQNFVVWMPPELAWWATTLDLTRLPDDLALQARQFLARAAGLEPRIRAELAASLATSVAARVTPWSPPGTPAEAYLAAVLAERSRRAWLAHPR